MNYFQRRRARRLIEQNNAGKLWLLPSSTSELTPADWQIVRLSLVIAIREHAKTGAFAAVEAATLTLDKISKLGKPR